MVFPVQCVLLLSALNWEPIQLSKMCCSVGGEIYLGSVLHLTKY